MTKLSKQLRIRLTPEQFRELSKALVKTKKNKSELVRDALSDYIDSENASRKPNQIQSNIIS